MLYIPNHLPPHHPRYSTEKRGNRSVHASPCRTKPLRTQLFSNRLVWLTITRERFIDSMQIELRLSSHSRLNACDSLTWNTLETEVDSVDWKKRALSDCSEGNEMKRISRWVSWSSSLGRIEDWKLLEIIPRISVMEVTQNVPQKIFCNSPIFVILRATLLFFIKCILLRSLSRQSSRMHVEMTTVLF